MPLRLCLDVGKNIFCLQGCKLGNRGQVAACVAGCSVGCAKCLLRIGIRVQPTIGVAGSQLMRVAAVHPIDCNLKDLLPCDFVLVCDCCGASMKARGMQSGM